MKQRNKYFQYVLVFFFLVLGNIGNLAAQERGRIIIIKRAFTFIFNGDERYYNSEVVDIALDPLPYIFILNAKNRDEAIQLFKNADVNAFVAGTLAETVTTQTETDIVVGELCEFKDDDITNKPWNGLGTYFVVVEGEDGWLFMTKAKKNLAAEVIVLNPSDFSRF